MTIDRADLARYLRQRLELGERDVFLETLSGAEAVRALAASSADAVTRRRGAAEEPLRASATPRERLAAPGTGRVREFPAVWALPPRAGDPAAAEALKALAREASGCTKCRLCEGRRTVVFGEGSPFADVVIVGEAPGSEEDRTGRPFVGPAGKLLDLLLLSVGFAREQVYICNVLKCRPPNNRDPLPDEVEKCQPYLHRQLELIAPRALVAVGNFAARTLLGSEAGISKLRGQVHSYRGVPVIAMFHPAYLLRSRDKTRSAWQDLQLLRQVLDEQA
ncbi:MAG: uracil-DNA glycosylase [Gemmatimonadetes bacterium]|nr:uracil-DNA glycosylase [Gemmatimonadota bacterium]